MKKILVLGGGGFIGGHLGKKLKSEGNWVRIVDLKNHEYFTEEEICDEFIIGDLRDPLTVSLVMFGPQQTSTVDDINSFDEVYQLAADMGGAGYIFTGDNDSDIMTNSALINLNVLRCAVKFNVKKIFYSSSACMYPDYNQTDPDNPNCREETAYPASPDSEYGWEKLFSERLYLSYHRNYGVDIRIARFHNIFGPRGSWKDGKEKAIAALCRKVAMSPNGKNIEVWGDGNQTRSFLYIDECLLAVEKLMNSDFIGPVNIGSEEMLTINDLTKVIINISGKDVGVENIWGEPFYKKYGFNCPIGVMGRNSNNDLYFEKIGWKVSQPISVGLNKTYKWIKEMVENDN